MISKLEIGPTVSTIKSNESGINCRLASKNCQSFSAKAISSALWVFKSSVLFSVQAAFILIGSGVFAYTQIELTLNELSSFAVPISNLHFKAKRSPSIFSETRGSKRANSG